MLQVLASRLLATLTWLNTSQLVFIAHNSSGHTTLNKMLVTLLTNLEAGHLHDPSLDTDEVLNVVHEAVVLCAKALGSSFPPLHHLTSVIPVDVTMSKCMQIIGRNVSLAGVDLEAASPLPAAAGSASRLDPNAAEFKPKNKCKQHARQRST